MRDPFSEGAFRVDQHAPHIVRVVELPDRQMEKAEGADVAVGGGVVLQERDRIVVVAGEAAVDRVALGARGPGVWGVSRRVCHEGSHRPQSRTPAGVLSARV